MGKDIYAQSQAFGSIVRQLRASPSPYGMDAVFITGDIANTGSKEEYNQFFEIGLLPLLEVLPEEAINNIFIIPGNHDVQRKKNPLVEPYSAISKFPQLFDPTPESLLLRNQLVERFDNFSLVLNPSENWLCSREGFSIKYITKGTDRIAVILLNTAWLSCGEGDRHQLTPGLNILRHALELVENAAQIIVCGHHPLDWLRDNEVKPIRALFSQYRVIYLHGHLHVTDHAVQVVADHSFIAIQAGAAFDSRSESHPPRVVLGSVNLELRQLLLRPLCWSRDQNEWIIETSAVPAHRVPDNAGYYDFPSPLALGQALVAKRATAKQTKLPDLPAGWQSITSEWLESHRPKARSQDDVIAFFDGRVPNWGDALDPAIPVREIVIAIEGDILSDGQASQARIAVLLGAGGEGKSTIVRQLVCRLVGRLPATVLWHHDAAAPFPEEFVLAHTHTGRLLVIASDEADAFAKQFYALLSANRSLQESKTYFILASRDSDWYAIGAHQLNWRPFAKYREWRLHGLAENDANVIVAAWAKAGERGLGKLKGLSHTDAVKAVLNASRSDGESEGAFLGAMLRVRIGNDLMPHLEGLLAKLHSRSAPGGTLLGAFSYIVVFHALNKFILTSDVLAQVLGCTVSDVRTRVLLPLGREAAAQTTGSVLLSRHRAVAECSMSILTEKYSLNREQIFTDTILAAVRLKRTSYVQYLHEWVLLTEHLFKTGERQIAINVASALAKEDPKDAHFVTKLSQLLRYAGHPDDAARVFRNAPSDISKNRIYYLEWAIAEGHADHPALGLFLAMLSISDQAEMRPATARDMALTLSGASRMLSDLHIAYGEGRFAASAMGACVVGLSIRPSQAEFKDFEEGIKRARALNLKLPANTADALTRMLDGFDLSAKFLEKTTPQYLPAASQLTFHGVERLLATRPQSPLGSTPRGLGRSSRT